MTIDEIKKYFADNKDSADVKAFLQELPVSAEKMEGAVDEYLKSKDGLKRIQSEADKMSAKSIDTWKKNFEEKELPKLVNERFNKEHPAESESDKKLRELSQKFELLEKEKNRESLKTKALKQFSEKKLPADLLDFIHADSDEVLDQHISKLSEIVNALVKDGVNERLKGAAIEPTKPAQVNTSGIIKSAKEYEALPYDARVKAVSEGRVQIPGLNLDGMKTSN